MARYLAGRAKKDRGRTKARTYYTALDPTARMGRDFAPFRGEEEFLLLDLKRAYSCHLLLTRPSIPQPIFVSVESFSGMFRSSSPLLRKSEPPVQVQDTIITAWTIRHPTRNRNDPIARAEFYQLSYISPSQVEHA
ncbi:hypothetical protein BUALT_Bualt14G0028000 [Buddleja alternifolia]|uniref:Uncharacterized protein n=1 Tax=Buddleja alternifolia TaxID=168488 RepID=A0AAV6WHM2_9LAMI|nr:hypothetical protein BUALT_Bualt14G0028000 [Buddleja alternifolia]